MCIAHRLLLSTSEISDATASMPSPGYFALQHRVAPPRKAYSLTSSAFIAFGALYPFSLFKPVFRGDHKIHRAKGILFRPILFHIKVFLIRPRKPQTRCLRRCSKRAARCRPIAGNRGQPQFRILHYEFRIDLVVDSRAERCYNMSESTFNKDEVE